MTIRRFLNVVPKAVRITAFTLVACGTLAGLVAGLLWRSNNFLPADYGGVMGTTALGLVVGLFFGSFLATWLLCLGFVYGDARQRGMRPILWVLVAALFPHLLGFLLYFVLRQPVPSNCSHCGRTVSLNQRFCSWCGNPVTSSTPGGAPMAVDPC